MKKTIFGLFLLVFGLGLGAYTWWQSPSTATNVDHGATEVSNVLGSETSLKPWQTKYFSTSIPTTLRPKSSNDTQSYGSYLLTSISPRISDQVGVTVAQLGNNSLDELPAVKLRLGKPDAYVPVSLPFAPTGAIAFTDDAAYETSIFWQHDNTYAAVVVSGTSARRAELEQAMQEIVANWTWQ